MKKLFIISLFALFCTPTHTHAWYEAYTQTTSSNNIKTDISVTATMAVADITITVTNPNKIPIENSLRVYSDILPSGGCETSILNKPIEMDGTTSTYTHTFRLSNLVPNKQYCFQYSGWPPKLFKTDPITTPTGNFFKWPLNVTDPTGQTVVLSGKIDITKYANLSELEVQFYYSKLPFSGTTNPPDTKWLNAHTSLAAGSGEGVAPDGSYYRKIDQLTPKAKYYYKQVIIVKGTTTVLATNFDATATFNSTEGYVPAGSAQEKSLEDKKTYNLLAPWPGLSKLMDPDLCAQQKIDGKLPKGAVCDINGFLNFAFKMLIGLTAVVLVLRLMYEGYQYIVTDVPFLKASAKSGFMTALTGLLLALSAYLILNTINPKLVSNSFNVASIEVGVEQSIIDPATYQSITGQVIKAKSEYINLVDTISQQQSIDACIVKATITVESRWVPNIIGCDENVNASDVPSRRAFIGSGIKLDGTTFTDSSAKNNCPKSINTSLPGYGLDWRFSKGGGLMQKTLFPPGYDTPAWYQGVKQGGTNWNSRTTPFSGFQTIIIPEQNIKAGIDILKLGLQKCGGNIESAFRLYQAGPSKSCNVQGDVLNRSVAKKMIEYQVCKNNPSGYAR